MSEEYAFKHGDIARHKTTGRVGRITVTGYRCQDSHSPKIRQYGLHDLTEAGKPYWCINNELINGFWADESDLEAVNV